MMKKYLGLLAAAVLALGLQSTAAQAHLFGKRSSGVVAAQLVIGLGTSGAAYALVNKHHHHHSLSKTLGSHRFWKWYGLTTVGCMALTPMMGAALVGHYEKRELKSSEVFIMLGDCVVPILGGLFWQAMFDAHPEWDRGTGGPVRR
jgi:hypothetical protein